jgi:hypothetical protein
MNAAGHHMQDDPPLARGESPPLVIVTHNTWLIPFGAPWMLGRAGRLIDHQCAVVQRLSDEAPEDPLVIVALQELWTFRVGPFWPLLWLMGVLQAALLQAGLVHGGHEPLLLRIAVLAPAALCSWLPLPFGLWDPKPRFARALAAAGVPHAVGLRRASLEPMLGCRRWPPPLMDSGLLLCTSRPVDESGFVPFPQSGSPEDWVNKGMLWARLGSLAVIVTHMSNERATAYRAPQRAALGELSARLLRLPGVERVLVVGDLNHRQGGSAAKCAGHVDDVLAALARGGDVGGAGGSGELLEAKRLSCDEATNEDGCIDHVVCVRRRGSPPLRPSESRVVDDLSRHVSDHNLLYVTVPCDSHQTGLGTQLEVGY